MLNELFSLTREAKQRCNSDKKKYGADDTFGLILWLALPCSGRLFHGSRYTSLANHTNAFHEIPEIFVNNALTK